MNPLLCDLLLCTDCTLVVVPFLDGMWYSVLSGSTVPLTIQVMVAYLSLLIPMYVIQSTKLHDRMAFLRELIMIRDSSLTLSGLLSSDELNDIISHVCTS